VSGPVPSWDATQATLWPFNASTLKHIYASLKLANRLMLRSSDRGRIDITLVG
jgi:hypothetical protein